ncbi:unnamed protein product [Didymodactylos carnosus]|uniref:Innexin n=1 Tax=Didymodactylos carnosus TaxID=1234261 RepID=A0A814UL92_9BILA|nr:unnamed protein product [Didymodactylos carnosus]CAF3939965.1 unnamed protein product [Didymodactylos carnosus]
MAFLVIVVVFYITVPAFFTGNYEEYTNNVCWVRNTYYVDENSQIPDDSQTRHDNSIRYYQWIPFILLVQAFFFFLPYVLWRALSQRSGVDVRDIVEAAALYKKSSDEKARDRLMRFIISAIDQYVDDPRRQSESRIDNPFTKVLLILCPPVGRYMGDYLRNLFLFIKVIYLLNVLVQIALLSVLLGHPFYSLGFEVLKILYEGKGWDYTSRYFPKVTFCIHCDKEHNDRLLRILSRDESTIDPTYIPNDGKKIHHYSRLYPVPERFLVNKLTLFDYFNDEYLEADGVFILRIIGTNASDFVSTRIIHELYERCCAKRFTPNPVSRQRETAKTTLYKYVIVPKVSADEKENHTDTNPFHKRDVNSFNFTSNDHKKIGDIEEEQEETHHEQQQQQQQQQQQAPETKRRTLRNTTNISESGSDRMRSGTLPFIHSPKESSQE